MCGPFHVYGCEKTLHVVQNNSKDIAIYTRVPRRITGIISFFYRQRSSVTKSTASLERHKRNRMYIKAHLKVPQLPRTGHNQHHDLGHAIPHRPRIRNLAQIPEIRLSLPLILLLSPDILKFHVQLSNLGGDFGDVGTVVVEVRTGFANCDVEVHSDVRGVGEPV